MQGDVNVLGQALGEAMVPDCPTASHDRLTLNRFQEVIERADYSPISAGEVLRIVHVRPSCSQLVAQLNLLAQEFQRDRTHGEQSHTCGTRRTEYFYCNVTEPACALPR